MGFVKISDDLPNWAWYRDNNTLLVYLRLLLGAVWCDTDYQNITLHRGQIATTLPQIARENGITGRQARTALSRLKTTGKVSVKTTSKFSIITLIDYDCSFGNVSQNVSRMTGKCQTNDRPTLLNTDIQSTEEQKHGAPSRSELNSVFGEVVKAFNENCKSLAPITGEPTYSQCHLIIEAQKRLNGVTFAEFFQRVERSAFLTGKSSSNFKADFNWILKPENMMKILSGNYDRSFEPNAPKNTFTPNPWANMTDKEAEELAAHFYD